MRAGPKFFKTVAIESVHLLLAFDGTRKGARKNFLALRVRAGWGRPWLQSVSWGTPMVASGKAAKREQGRRSTAETSTAEG